MRKFLVLLAAAICVVPVFAGPEAEAPRYTGSGFTIPVLDADAAGFKPLQMALPPSDDFSPNINVQIQEFPGTMEEYVEISKGSFTTHGLKQKQLKSDRTSALFEFTGVVSGRSLHFYIRALKRGDRVYLATATATEKQWPVASKKLVASIDGFALTP